MNGDPMSQASREMIAAAQPGDGVHVSPITAWEIANLAARGRLALTLSPTAWFNALLALPGTPPRDPTDRILAATAREHGHILITRAGELIPYAQSGHLEAISC